MPFLRLLWFVLAVFALAHAPPGAGHPVTFHHGFPGTIDSIRSADLPARYTMLQRGVGKDQTVQNAGAVEKTAVPEGGKKMLAASAPAALAPILIAAVDAGRCVDQITGGPARPASARAPPQSS